MRCVARIGERKVHTGFWWRNLQEGDHGRRRLRREDNIKINLNEIGWEAWTDLIWFRAGQVAVNSMK
jgi:hypothetical protein